MSTPAPTRLLTLVQISDLHIAEIDPGSGDAALSPLFKKLISNFTWFDGLLGHHSIALLQLQRFWRALKATEPDARVLVSGDLTRCGGDVELDNATHYLGSSLTMPWGTVGLGDADWLDLAIPGNHDHWPGRAQVFGGPHPTVDTKFLKGRYPWLQQLSTSSKHKVQIIGINSDADVSPHRRSRLLAIGKFQSQLTAAKTLLLKNPDYDVRVLVLHHSWHKKKLLRIAKASRGALGQFLDDENVRLVLTGHVHTTAVKAFQPVGGGLTVYECRCGTTTQIDKMAYDAKSLLGIFPARPDWPANTLLVHRLYVDAAGHLEWQVETYRRTRSGFATMGSVQHIPL